MLTETGKSTGTSIYESLAARLRRTISDGEYSPGQLIGSEHELARRENISRMTVRRASELLIHEGLLERRPGKGLYVRSAPNTVAGGTVQVIVGNLAWEPALQMSRGVQAGAKADAMHVQLYDAHGDFELDLSLVEQLPTAGAKGAVIISTHSPRFSQAICRLHSQGFPFVLLDHRMQDIEVSSVTSDNHSGGYQVGRMLIGQGHRHIAFIGDMIAATCKDRLAGLRDAMGDGGLPFSRALVVDLVAGADRFGDWSECVGQGIEQLMSATPRPTAIFCSCDGVARMVYKALDSLGLRIPQEVSVVGYDDDPLAEWLQPGLTTVRQPFGEMGLAAMELLRQRIADPSVPPEFRALPVELVLRQSVSAPMMAEQISAVVGK